MILDIDIYKPEYYEEYMGQKFKFDVLNFLLFKDSFHLTILNITISLRWGDNEKFWIRNYHNKKECKK